jgi:hypothetical protein
VAAITAALGVAGTLLIGAYFALHDGFKSWLADSIPGFPRGCSANGWEALPGLLLIFGATGAVVWAWRHPADNPWLGYAVKTALVLLSIVSVVGTLVWLVATGGMFCTVD